MVDQVNSRVRVEPEPEYMLLALARDGALTEYQARRLSREWFALEDEWWRHPEYASIREFTRAWLDSQRPHLSCVTTRPSAPTLLESGA